MRDYILIDWAANYGVSQRQNESMNNFRMRVRARFGAQLLTKKRNPLSRWVHDYIRLNQAGFRIHLKRIFLEDNTSYRKRVTRSYSTRASNEDPNMVMPDPAWPRS